MSKLLEGGALMNRFSDIVMRTAEVIAITMMILLALSLFVGVLSRYIFNISIPELEALRNLSIFWLVFMGSALAIKEKAHLKIDIFDDYLGKKGVSIKNRIVYIIVLIAIIILIVIGIEAWRVGLDRRELVSIRFLDSQPNLIYYYSSILIGSLFMLFFHLTHFKETFLKSRGEN